MLKLDGKVAVVTGSSRGIGNAIAHAFAKAGAAVLINGTHPETAKAEADKLCASGYKAAWSAADLSQPNGATQLLEETEKALGKPGILVLNASIEIAQEWQDLTTEAMARQTEINIFSTVRLIQSVLPSMLENGQGRVLAIGSIQEDRPNSRHMYYAATKCAQTSLILNFAKHVATEGVTFNVLKPGAILTDRNREVLSDKKYLANAIERIPQSRIGVPEDCAAAALLLCSNEGSYINGAELAVDGGLRL